MAIIDANIVPVPILGFQKKGQVTAGTYRLISGQIGKRIVISSFLIKCNAGTVQIKDSNGFILSENRAELFGADPKILDIGVDLLADISSDCTVECFFSGIIS